MEPNPYQPPKAESEKRREDAPSCHKRLGAILPARTGLWIVVGAVLGAIVADNLFGSPFGMGDNSHVQIVGALAGGIVGYVARFLQPNI